MLPDIPKSLTTTQIQRNPKIIDKINKDNEIRIFTKNGEQVGVYLPMKVYEKVKNELNKKDRVEVIDSDRPTNAVSRSFFHLKQEKVYPNSKL